MCFHARVYIRKNLTSGMSCIQLQLFLLKKDGETYSMFFKHHRIEKKHIFAVFDEDRNIVYPKNLEKPVVIEGPGADISIEKLSDVEYRNYFIRQTYEEQRQVARSITGIRNIMLIQLALVVIAGSIAALAI